MLLTKINLYAPVASFHTAFKGVLSFLLIFSLGPERTTELSVVIAPVFFVATFVTSWSGELYVRGSVSIATESSHKKHAILIDTFFLVGGLLAALGAWNQSGLVWLACISGTFWAFGQIAFNFLVNRRLWNMLAICYSTDALVHAVMFIYYKNLHSEQFLFLISTKWILLTIAAIIFASRTEKISLFPNTRMLEFPRVNSELDVVTRPITEVAHVAN